MTKIMMYNMNNDFLIYDHVSGRITELWHPTNTLNQRNIYLYEYKLQLYNEYN